MPSWAKQSQREITGTNTPPSVDYRAYTVFCCVENRAPQDHKFWEAVLRVVTSCNSDISVIHLSEGKGGEGRGGEVANRPACSSAVLGLWAITAHRSSALTDSDDMSVDR
jgi:hypothetical protein